MLSSTQNIELSPKKTNQKELAFSCFCNTSTYIFGAKQMGARDRDWDIMKGSKEGRQLNQNGFMDKTPACLKSVLMQTTTREKNYTLNRKGPHTNAHPSLSKPYRQIIRYDFEN